MYFFLSKPENNLGIESIDTVNCFQYIDYKFIKLLLFLI